MPTRPSFSLILTSAILAGCGTSTPPKGPSTEVTKASAPASEVRSAPAVPASPAVEPVTTRTPEEVSRLAVQSLIDAQPEKFWGLLPPSYQGRINKVVQKGAMRFADQELLNAYQGVLRELAELMKDKQEFLLKTPVLPFHEKPEVAQSNWNEQLVRLNRIADSELFDSLPLKKFDGQRFCAGPLADIIAVYNQTLSLAPEDPQASLQANLSSAKFTIVDSSEDEMTLSLTTGPNGSGIFKFRKVEGHWVPEPFIAAFDDMMGVADSWIEGVSPADFERQKATLLGQAEAIREYLKELRSINNQIAFDEGMNRLLLLLSPGDIKIVPAPQPGETAPQE